MDSRANPWQAPADIEGRSTGHQFQQPGLAPRATPFALVTFVATLSILVPQNEVRSWAAYAVSIALLLLCAGAFLLPWNRLPAWAPVLVPLLHTASVLPLVLASGPASGVGLVLLVPLVWTALFHLRWESAWVVVTVVVQTVTSFAQHAPAVVIGRRVVLWATLGTLIAVATHGLRDRIKDSMAANMELQAEIRELSLARERDRIADDLREGVVRRLFAAGLDLHATATLIGEGPAQSRLMHGVSELDEAIQLLRASVFDLGEDGAPPKDATEPPAPDEHERPGGPAA